MLVDSRLHEKHWNGLGVRSWQPPDVAMLRTTLIASGLVALLGGRARADDVPLAMVLAAVDQTPTAHATALDVAAADARTAAAGAWSTTVLHVGTNRLTAHEVAGITVPLPILGTLGAARDEASAHAMVIRDEGAVARRELRRRAMTAWLELARADTDTVTLATAAVQAAEIERIAQGRFDAGAGGEVDVTSAHAARARADVAVAAARRESQARSAELAGLLAWDPTRERHATGPLPGGTEDLATLRRTLARHPERAAALARVAEGEATEHRIAVAYRPGLAAEVTGSFGDPTLTGTDVFAGLAIEVPLFGHLGDQARAAARDTGAARARLAAIDGELAGMLVAAYQRWQEAGEHVASLERDVLPAQRRAAQLAQQAYREGARDLSTALQAARDLAAVDAELANARIDAAQAWVELELAAGKTDDAR